MIDPLIIGTWRLKSTQGIDDTGKVLPPPYGPTPNGLLCFEPSGRMYCVLCDGRAEMPAGEARPLMSYTGRYTFDGKTLLTYPDASSDADRIGSEQVRNVRFENGGLILTPPRRMFAGVMQKQQLVWERVA